MGLPYTCYSAAYVNHNLRAEGQFNLGDGIWLAWANDTAAHYAFFSDFNATSYSVLVIINIINIRLLFCLLLPCDGE